MTHSNRMWKIAKTGQTPGEIGKHSKIKMLEGDVPFNVFPWQTITVKAAKTYRKDFKKAAKAKVKRRLQRDMQAQLDGGQGEA